MSFSNAEVDNMITGICLVASFILMVFSTSMPFIFGRLRSSITRSGINSLMYLSFFFSSIVASQPSFATERVKGKLLSYNASVVSITSPSLSSTKSMWIGFMNKYLVKRTGCKPAVALPEALLFCYIYFLYKHTPLRLFTLQSIHSSAVFIAFFLSCFLSH
jgi:hypothetical protein